MGAAASEPAGLLPPWREPGPPLSVSSPLTVQKKKQKYRLPGGAPRSPWGPVFRGHEGKGGGGYAGVSAARLSVSPSLVGLRDERSAPSVASRSSSHRS